MYFDVNEIGLQKLPQVPEQPHRDNLPKGGQLTAWKPNFSLRVPENNPWKTEVRRIDRFGSYLSDDSLMSQ